MQHVYAARAVIIGVTHSLSLTINSATKTMFCAVAGMGAPGAPDLDVEQLLGKQNTYALQAVQQALASGVCDPWSGGGKTGNDKVKVTRQILDDGTAVYVADPSDLKKIDIGPSAQIPAVSNQLRVRVPGQLHVISAISVRIYLSTHSSTFISKKVF